MRGQRNVLPACLPLDLLMIVEGEKIIIEAVQIWQDHLPLPCDGNARTVRANTYLSNRSIEMFNLKYTTVTGFVCFTSFGRSASKIERFGKYV